MKRINFLRNRRLALWLIVAYVVLGGPAGAGNWHNSPLVCSDCHTMHASTGDGATLYNAGAGYTNLLKSGSTTKLCLDCHASNGANAISTFRVAGSTISDSWSGGRFGPDAVYTTIATPGDYSNTYGHDLEVATNTTSPPGADAGDAYRKGGNAKMLSCASCHDQHGNSNYRNLSYDPNTSNAEIYGCTVTVTPDGPYVSDTGARTTEVWKSGTTSYNEGMSSFCQDCHEKFGPVTAFGGPTGGTAGFYTGKYDAEGLVDNNPGLNTHHPIDLDMTAATGANYDAAVGRDTFPLGKSNAAFPWAAGTGNHVQCVTCHWAHGSPTNQNDALRWNMTTDLLAGGSSGCQTCHSK